MRRISSTAGPRVTLLRCNEPLVARPNPFSPSSHRHRRTTSSLDLDRITACRYSSFRDRSGVTRATRSPRSAFPILPNRPARRSFWSVEKAVAEAEKEAHEAAEAGAKQSSSPLPVPPIVPSGISATSLIKHSTAESLLSLPECKMVLDFLNGSNPDGGESSSIEAAQAKEAHSNLKRARDILQSMPELQLATLLLEADLHSFCGEFDSALDALSRYEHSKKNNDASKMSKNESKRLQFLRAKLLVHSGKFSRALAEYEDLLEGMEREAERQMQRMQTQRKRGGEESLPVIHGAAALNGVGVTSLLLHARGDDDASESDIIESLETVTEMLLESRKEALLSPAHARLAVDLGLAASISLTNLGVAHRLVSNDNKGGEQSMECWKRGLETLDFILQDAANTATIIPNWVIQCMESVRGRLYCNMAWSLLGLNLMGKGGKSSDETLKEASEAAKKALDISDELINGSKLMREYADAEKDLNGVANGGNGEVDSTDTTIISTNSAKGNAPSRHPLSVLWAAYHRAESARALGLVAGCYTAAGAAVTAEGLFQSALDASSSYPLGQRLGSRGGGGTGAGKGVSLSSPNLGLIARDVRTRYATLLDGWEKRRGDADRLRSRAREIEEEGVLKGYVERSRDDSSGKANISGLEASLWLFAPSDFER